LIKLRTLALICALALPTVVVAGCGDDDGGGDEDPGVVLEQIFNNDERISSGVLNLSLEASAEGDQGGSFSASLGGPFQGDADDPNAVPQLDLTASVSGEGAGQSVDFEGGLTVSEDNAFVTYQDQAYEVGEETFGQVRDQLEAQAGAAQDTQDGSEASLGAFFEQFDIDPTTWLSELENEGTEDIDGESAIHLHGVADVQQILSDLVDIGSQVPGAEAQGLDPAQIEEQLSQVEQFISEATIDVYGGEDDRLLRGLDVNLGIEPPQEAGVSNVDLVFSLRLSEVNESQTIEAPSDAQPIEDLLGQFGVDPEALGDLGNLGAGGLGGGAGGGAGGGGGGGAGGPGAGGGTTPDFDAYQRCVEEAGDDTAELLACGELLQ
jgi:hypothetical protein